MGGLHRVAVIAAGRKPRRFPCGIDAPHLRRDRGEPGDAQHQDHHQGGDGERRLDGGGAVVTG